MEKETDKRTEIEELKLENEKLKRKIYKLKAKLEIKCGIIELLRIDIKRKNECCGDSLWA